MAKDLNEDIVKKHSKAEDAILKLLEEIASNVDNNIEKRLNKSHTQILKKYFYEDYTAAVPYFVLVINLFTSLILYFSIDDIFLFSLASILFLMPIYAYIENKDTFLYLKKISGENSDRIENRENSEILKYLEKNIFGFNFKHNYISYLYISIIPFVGIVMGNLSENKLYLFSIIIIPIMGLIPPIFTKRIKNAN